MKDMKIHGGAGLGAGLGLPPEEGSKLAIVLGFHAISVGLHGSSWNFMMNTR